MKHIIFVWIIMGSLWAMDVGAICMVNGRNIQLASNIIMDRVLFYHVFMYIIVLSCVIYAILNKNGNNS